MEPDNDKTDDADTTAYQPVPRVVLPRVNRPSRLQLVRGPGAPLNIPLAADEIVIGRSTGADLSFEVGGLSRRHVLLRKSGTEYVCKDLDSRNGVFLNGIRIYSVTLRNGDTLQIGDLVFLFEQGD